eukprot:1001825-Pyramimonas_sp.AAC.1
MDERRHDILRRLLLRAVSLLSAEGIVGVPLEIVVAGCCLAKRLLARVGGYSPCRAPRGRLPPFAAEVEPASEIQLGDRSA